MLIGYARVSTESQDLTVQINALTQAGCSIIYRETISGGEWDRPQLQLLLTQLNRGDVVVVMKLDRLSRALKDTLVLFERMESMGVGFKSLNESIDTTSPAGRMMMQMIGSFAEYERAMIRERTLAGLARARSEGRVGGRKPKLSVVQKSEAVDMVRSGKCTAVEVARSYGVHPSTISRAAQ